MKTYETMKKLDFKVFLWKSLKKYQLDLKIEEIIIIK